MNSKIYLKYSKKKTDEENQHTELDSSNVRSISLPLFVDFK